MTDTEGRSTSRLAIGALYISVIGIGLLVLALALIVVGADAVGGPLVIASLLTEILAFVLAIIAILAVSLWRRHVKGFLPAIVALVLTTPFLFAFLLGQVVAIARTQREKANTGMYNLALLGSELEDYAEANAGYLPDAAKWCDLLIEHNPTLSRSNFTHPQPQRIGLTGQCHFAFNSNLSRMRLAEIPDNVVLLFEADGPWNLHGTGELLEARNKAQYSYVSLLFVDRTISDYWYYEHGIRRFSKDGGMYYDQPRWKP